MNNASVVNSCSVYHTSTIWSVVYSLKLLSQGYVIYELLWIYLMSNLHVGLCVRNV